MTADPRPADETASPQWPRRPAPLIVGVVAAALGALFFAMTAEAADSSTQPGQDAGLPSVALLFALLAIRFNWARNTITVLLGLLTLLWAPSISAISSPELDQYTLGIYATMAVVTSVVAIVLLFRPRSNDFYRGVVAWRTHRQARKTGGAGD
jgi:phosphatidylserine synthase